MATRAASNNNTHPITLQNTTSVFPTPPHPPDTSSTEFRIFLGFLVFGTIAGAALLLYPIVVFALDRRGRKHASATLTNSQSGLTMSEEEMQERVRRPQPAVLH